MKYLVSIETKINANDQEQADELANGIHVYHSLEYGGDELDPSVTIVQPVVELNDMSADALVDHVTNELDQVAVKLDAAFFQTNTNNVTMKQILRIQNLLNEMHVTILKSTPVAK